MDENKNLKAKRSRKRHRNDPQKGSNVEHIHQKTSKRSQDSFNEELEQKNNCQGPQKKSKFRKLIENEVSDHSKKLSNNDDTTQEASTASDFASDISFEALSGIVSENTMKAIQNFNFSRMSHIQEKTIFKSLEGRDIRGTSKTGSGKTLAFLIPAVEHLVRCNFEPNMGVGSLILSPTRELAVQTYSVLRQLMHHHKQTHALVIGGKKKIDGFRLQGVNILVATPGRLLDDMCLKKDFNWNNVGCLVIDEADKMMKMKFLKEMKTIIELLPSKRQTLFFSATRNAETEALAECALKPDTIDVDLSRDSASLTVSSLTQCYIKCPLERRLDMLYMLIRKKYKKKKIMVFMSTCVEVKFYNELFNLIDTPVFCIHGELDVTERTASFLDFKSATGGVLLCTDVAARGWDACDVDWIVQFDPPSEVETYVHRVGRTARAGKEGSAMIFLAPEELDFVQVLRVSKIEVQQNEVDWEGVPSITKQVQGLLRSNFYLMSRATAAFKSFLISYQHHELKNAFDFYRLDQDKLCQSFGLTHPPPDCEIDYVSERDKRLGQRGQRKKHVANMRRKFLQSY